MNISGKTADLQEALKYLNGFQFHGFRLGLERMEAILNVLDSPEKNYPALHVAGTNGKGSTCAVINSILSCAGYRTGFYSSPHLYRLNERFRTGNREITDQELVSILARIREFIEQGYEMSYFEYTTAAAMLWFRERGVDLAVFETGLGGRLDATNVIDPMLSVITNIALEHQSYLGKTIEEIAFEKAGIIKPGRPVICGVSHGPALHVIEKMCRDQGALIRVTGRDFSYDVHNGEMTWRGWGGTEIRNIAHALKGEHQADNTALAIAAVKALPFNAFHVGDDDIRRGCAIASWPGRSEIFTCRGRRIILDGAHNINGIEALVKLLESEGISRGSSCGDVLLWACSDEGGDKNFMEMLKKPAHMFRQVVITEPPGPRRPVTLEAWNEAEPAGNCLLEKEWGKATDDALAICPPGGVICVAGSLYLVGSVRKRLLG